MQGDVVQSLDWEDPLEEEMATHSSVVAEELPWTEEYGGLQFAGHKESDMTEHNNPLLLSILKWVYE